MSAVSSTAVAGSAPYAETHEGPRPHPEITRHLAAAVHLKPGFAQRVINTYRTGPQEALPPESGVNAPVLLTQALIARLRRGIRDALTMASIGVSACVLFVVEPGFVVFWLAFWLLWVVAAGVRRLLVRNEDVAGTDRLGTPATVLLLVVWTLVSSVLWVPSTFVATDGEWARVVPLPSTWWPVLIALSGVAAVFGVLWADKLILQHLLARHGSPTPPTHVPALVDQLTQYLEGVSTRGYQPLLDELARTPAGHVLVHRDRESFVGHGCRVNAWTMAIVLKQRDTADNDGVHSLRPSDIYDAVSRELTTLKGADMLAPSQRLRELSVLNMMVVSSKGLARHRDEPLGCDILPNAAVRPATAVPPETLRGVMDHSREWARLFQRCSVSSWDSDLIVSTFLHVACDNRTLYLEWNTSCLFPLHPAYQRGGTFTTTPAHTGRLALRELRRLPGSMRRRWRSARHAMSMTMTPPGDAGPFGYGSVKSIREIAAHDRCTSEFQDLDGQRYSQLLERRALSAVHRHLSDNGYATEELESRIDTVINNTTLIKGGHFTGAQNFGAAGTATAETATTETPATDGTTEETT